jgi:sugar lactone lactonase YvrE
MMTTLSRMATAAAIVLSGALLAACGNSGTSTGSGGSTTASGGSGGGAAEPQFVAKTDPAKGELVEGLFVTKGTAYIGYAALGKVEKVDIATGKVTDFGSIPQPPMNGGFMLGIVVDDAGSVLVGFGGGPGMVVKNGVYKIPAAGGAVQDPWATNAEMNFPNGLLLDGTDLFVADSGGAIFKIKSDGSVTKWASDPALTGTDMSCKNGAPFPLGANGIVKIGSDFYLSNTNLGSIVKVPINGDGSAGTAKVVAGPDCNALGGIDGIAVDADGKSILGVLNGQSKLVRIDPAAGKVTGVFAGAPLDNPASISVDTSAKPTAYITNSAFFDQKAPAPGLLSLALQ